MADDVDCETIFRGYKTELDPTRDQVVLFMKHLGTARWAYNWGLQRKIETYRATGKTITRFDLEKELTRLKRADASWLFEVSRKVPSEALKDLETAFQRFFRGRHGAKRYGFPRYKARRERLGSFRNPGDSIKVSESHIWLPRIGWVRLKEHGYLPASGVHLVAATVSERAGRWFVGLTVSYPAARPLPHLGPVVGLDVGLMNLAVLSDGTTHPRVRSFRASEKQLRRAQRAQSRRTKGSDNWKKAVRRVAVVHARIRDQRRDRLHKLTTELTRTKSLIVVEDFQAKALSRNRSISGSMWDAAPGEFLRQLADKSRWNGGRILVAPLFFPSTKLCSNCGWLASEVPLNQRVFRCGRCGVEVDRDLNAAKNLAGLAASPADSNACGEDVTPYLAAVLVEAGTVADDGGRSSWKMSDPRQEYYGRQTLPDTHAPRSRGSPSHDRDARRACLVRLRFVGGRGRGAGRRLVGVGRLFAECLYAFAQLTENIWELPCSEHDEHDD
jgi:putative transposase